MDWRLKCLAHYLAEYLPRAVERALRRRISGRYLFNLTDEEFAAYCYHVENFRRLPKPGRVLEFGAGSNLLSALMLSAAGAPEVFTYDLSRLATVERVNHVIRQLRSRLPGDWPEIADLDQDLTRHYRIRYRAPGDARYTGLPAGSVDFFCSTSTLEHIPAPEIVRILAECRRVASKQALFSFIIDYHDHYATADAKITRVNFYRYSEAVWRIFNPSGHFQNRLRHSDYEQLFRGLGLSVLENRSVVPPIAVTRIHKRFQRYSQDDLMALNGFFVLRAEADHA
jgi:hypothetical protein